MSWRCPDCRGELALEGDRAACGDCGRAYPSADGVLDLRLDPSVRAAPSPLRPGDADVAHEHLARGASWRVALEELLVTLPVDRAEALMLRLREGRGAWLVVTGCAGGPALFIGNALSGTVVALARAGHDVTVIDRAPERARLGRARDAALAAGRTRTAIVGDAPRLPFGDAAFALVVHEGELPTAHSTWGHDLREVRRVAAGELVLTAENRLGYKLSRNVRGEFRVRRPLEWLARALRPRDGLRTLAGYRRALADAGFEDPRAYALYPHADEFAQVAALDRPEPRIFVGPLERRNRAKVLAARLGLVPWLTPSFAWTAGRADRAGGTTRLERLLSAIAAELDEPVPIAEHVVATRGNSVVVHTRPERPDGEAGCWTLHVPLSPHQRALVERHVACLGELARDHPRVPAPRFLFAGELEGVYCTVERRLAGLSLSQLGGTPPGILPAVGDALAALATEPPRALDDALLDELVTRKVEAVATRVRDDATARNVRDLGARLRDELGGERLPLVLQHADLRPKHVQVATGALVGLLDWGSSVLRDLPYFDALHVVVQARKQQAGLSPGATWELARTSALLDPEERRTLSAYAERVGVGDRARRALELGYPIWVGAQAERTWDFSRPRWLHRQFGL